MGCPKCGHAQAIVSADPVGLRCAACGYLAAALERWPRSPEAQRLTQVLARLGADLPNTPGGREAEAEHVAKQALELAARQAEITALRGDLDETQRAARVAIGAFAGRVLDVLDGLIARLPEHARAQVVRHIAAVLRRRLDSDSQG